MNITNQLLFACWHGAIQLDDADKQAIKDELLDQDDEILRRLAG